MLQGAEDLVFLAFVSHCALQLAIETRRVSYPNRPEIVNELQAYEQTRRPSGLMAYGAPSNLSPASEEYRQLVDERVEKIRAANPDADMDAVPVDLVTCSGSGLDPEISPDAAEYQVPRLAKATGKSEGEVREIIAQCTKGRFLGVFGEPTVNVLKVNLMLDGAL